jgi:predicted ATPase
VVGTFRDTELTHRHLLTQTLGELCREPSFQRKLLQGLSEEEVSAFITMTVGSAPPQGLARVVHERTEGNPLFMTQVVQLLSQEGELIPERMLEYSEPHIRMPDGGMKPLEGGWPSFLSAAIKFCLWPQ